ncbi:UxaA family hydrolase [Cupriavidus necator]|uniref:UxaA family hydrolase n=1 Tax=Cupriavidus necator TaxID=106590 RepID=UPI00339D67CF
MIGVANSCIHAGAHVHVHYVGMVDAAAVHVAGCAYRNNVTVETPETFEGYMRADGRVRSRNFMVVTTSVNCSATVCRHIVQAGQAEAAAFPNVGGIVAAAAACRRR